MSAFHDNALIGASGQQGYKISRSVRLRSSASAYFNRTFGSGSRTTWTWSCWIKRGAVGTVYPASNHAQTLFGLNDSDKIYFYEDALWLYLGTGATYTAQPSDKFRDPSAWYHIVVVLDTTNATSGDRVRIYVNNRRVTISQTMPTQNWAGSNFNSAINHNIGKADNGNLYYLDGYLTEIHFIDGQALTPSSFGETDTSTGVWKPKKYTGTYGTNGFYLNFSDNSNNTSTTIGKDYSGNGNNWTPNNISVTAGVTYDSMIDVPTPYADGGTGRGNYCVLNRLDADTSSVSTSITNGNLTASGTTYGATVYTCSMQIPQTGKWYWEVVYSTITTTIALGVRSSSTGSTDIQYYSNGNKNVGGTTTAYGATWTTGDIIACAVDRDAGTVTWYKNNVSQGAISIPNNSAIFDIAFNVLSPYGSTTFNANFGQRPFSYTPPTGFVALNTQNLPTPTISNGANYMNASLWTGDASTPRAVVSNLAFSPDLVWTKDRSVGYQHSLQDTVRGTGASKKLYSSLTEAENGANAVYGHINSFDSNGFTVATGTSGAQHVNASGVTYVGWSWKAGGASSSNTAGSITSTVSAGATQGFSVVTWSGSGAAGTIGHGLNAVPAMLITKNRTTSATNWVVWHKNFTGSNTITDAYYMYLNGTNGQNQSGGVFYKGTDINSITFGFQGGNSNVNASGSNYVAYCFSEVAGYSKFGSYTGNGSADGTFVYCGFRPRFIMIKRTDTTSNWVIWDTARDTYNAGGLGLYPNLSAAEDDYRSSNPDDILSNGFKLRANYANVNASGGTYIFMAVAENPFKNSLAR